jgi:uncharacterized protein CbrC (UPF0167 family)
MDIKKKEMRNKMNNIEITCQTCGTTATQYHEGTTVQRMYLDGERYYGSPIKQGSIIVKGNSCGSCVRVQARERNALIGTVSSPLPIREPRVNEMP